MSLSVHDPRSRGRSKSPGRERSRSRDIRAPSPPEVKPNKSYREHSKKSPKKYYSDDSSDSGARSKRSAKKYYEDSESDSRTRSKNSSSKYYEDDDSDPRTKSRKSSKKYYEDDSDSDDRNKKYSKKYYEDDSSGSDHRSKSKRSSKKRYDESDSSSEGDNHTRKSDHKSSKHKYEAAEPKHKRGSLPNSHSTALTRQHEYNQSSKPQFDRPEPGRHPGYASLDRYEHGKPSDYARLMSLGGEKHDHKSPGTELPGQYKWEYDHPSDSHGQNQHAPTSLGSEQARHMSLAGSGNLNVNVGGGYNQQPQYGHPSSQSLSPQFTQPQYRQDNTRKHSGSITSTNQYQYADLSHQITYGSKTDSRKLSYTQSAKPQFEENKSHAITLHAKPTEGLGSRLHRLSVSGGVAGGLSLTTPGQSPNQMQGGLPPGSPLLEAYHGTYQSISPMPSPLVMPSKMDEDLSDLEPLSTQYSSDDIPEIRPGQIGHKKRVSFYNPEKDAIALAAALKHTKLDSEPIIEILPRLSHDNILELRTEYKKHAKTGGKGINIAKHIKMKVPGNLGKIAYAVALGRWESEAYWANFWYQSNSSRRELLIESLMGRTNSDIIKIKDAFSDKRYNDSLEKCMQTELKKDKFRNAVLLALEEKRMSETEKLSFELVRRDVQDLYRALMSKEGGETAMIEIIVVRSDNHLREVLRVFEGTYHKNFAREMIQKSRNLVVRSLCNPLIFPLLVAPSFSLFLFHIHH